MALIPDLAHLPLRERDFLCRMLLDPRCSSEQGKKKMPAMGIVVKSGQTLLFLSASQRASEGVFRPSPQKSQLGDVGARSGMTHSNSPKLMVNEKKNKGS